MAIQSNFPAIRPSLLLDFANSKRLDPRITFTRASTARFYDGFTVAKAEENLFTRSQELDNAAWVASDTSVTANQTTAPDGTSTAELLAANTSSAQHILARGTSTGPIGINAGVPYAFSVFLKKGTGATAPDVMQLAFPSATFGSLQYANFDINAGTVGSSNGVTASIVSFGNGWYRCAIVATATTANATSAGALVAFTNNNDGLGRLPSYVDATTSDVFVWGAQLEQRSAVTAYTPTTTAPITNYIPVLQTAQAGVPRFDHNPITGESLGLLIEEQRTNLALQSEDFSTTWTTAFASVRTNVIVAPDGSLTGDQLVEDTSAAQSHDVRQTFTKAALAIAYTASVYLKGGVGRNARLQVDAGAGLSGNNASVTFDLTAGTISVAAAALGTFSGASANITPAGNGWYRCLLTFTSGTETSLRIFLFTADGTSAIYTGDGYSGVFLWGAQLEAGAFATSYIPTTAATATRQPDAASMTGANFTSWYDAAEGTLYAEARDAAIADGNVRYSVLDINSATTTNAIRFGKSTGGGNADQVYLSVVVGGTGQAYFAPTGTITAGTAYRFAAAYKVNDFAATLNAGTVGTDSAGTIPVVSQVNIGSRADGSNRYNGTVAKLAYYPARLTDAQLQAITG